MRAAPAVLVLVAALSFPGLARASSPPQAYCESWKLQSPIEHPADGGARSTHCDCDSWSGVGDHYECLACSERTSDAGTIGVCEDARPLPSSACAVSGAGASGMLLILAALGWSLRRLSGAR